MNKYNRLLILIIILLVGVNGFFIYEHIKNKSINSTTINNYEISGISSDLTEVVKDNKSSVVTITNNKNIGSGFIYQKDKNKFFVLTAYHVIDDDNNLVVLNSGATLKSTIKGYDALLDLAVLEVESNLDVKPINIGNSSLCKNGEFIISIGTPSSLEYAGSVELGMISNNNITLLNSIEFNNSNIEYYNNYIQVSGNITSGYSGSPIINMNGEVIGMCLMENNKNTFVSPINEVTLVANKIINDEEYAKLNLGIKGTLISDMENYEKASLNIPLDVVSGLYVKEMLKESTAELMGVKPNDIILSINGKIIDDRDTLLEILYSNNNDLKIKILRNNEELELSSVIYD